MRLEYLIIWAYYYQTICFASNVTKYIMGYFQSTTNMTNPLSFGGLDVAIRVDNTALTILDLIKEGDKKILEQVDTHVWPHIHPRIIEDDLSKIQRARPMVDIGYDRLGTGEMIKLFPQNLPMTPVVSTMQEKHDLIGQIKHLASSEQLIIHDSELYREIMEQEKYISDAGNILYRHPSGFHDDRFWSLAYAVKVATDYIRGHPNVIARVIAAPVQDNPDLDELIDREISRI